MNKKHYVGNTAKSVTTGTKQLPISKVILNGDNDAVFIAGTDSGQTLETYVPTATQQMANDILARVRGFQYQGYVADSAYLPPTAELGDGVTVGGVYGILASREYSFTPKMTATISSPYETEEDHEYNYQGNYALEIKNKVQQGQLYYGTRISRKNGLEIVKTDGNIEKSRVILNSDRLAFYNDNGNEAFYYDATAGVFRLSQYANVEDALGGSTAFSLLKLDVDGLDLAIQDAEGNIAILDATAKDLQSQIQNVNGSISEVNQKADNISASVTTVSTDLDKTKKQVADIDIKANQITSTVEETVKGLGDTNTKLSETSQTADKIYWLVKNDASATSSTFTMTDRAVQLVANRIDFTGYVTFNSLKTADGTTVINGSNITTGTISASRLNLQGAIQESDLSPGLSSKISNMQSDISAIDQYATSIRLSVSNYESSSRIELTANGVTIEGYTIEFTGMVTFNDLSTSGATTINGANITTGTISADRIKAGSISLEMLDEDATFIINDAHEKASDANTAAHNARTDVINLANGYFHTGATRTFIDYKSIYSPEIYAPYMYTTTLEIHSTDNNSNGGLYLYGKYDDDTYGMFAIKYQIEENVPHAYLYSPSGGYIVIQNLRRIGNPYSTDLIEIYGNVVIHGSLTQGE